MVISTVYTSNKIIFEEIPYPDLYSKISAFFQNYCIAFGYKHDAQSNVISIGKTQIEYGLYHSSQNKRYFLNFIPKNIWKWSTKNVLKPAIEDLLKFFNLLPESLEFNQVNFIKTKVEGSINISDWNFYTEPDLGYTKINEIQNLFTIKKIGSGIFNYYKQKIDKNLIIINAASSGYITKINNLVDKISPLFNGTINKYDYSDSVIEKISLRSDINELFILLFRDGVNFDDKKYRYCKNFFINNSIPSQVIDIKNYDAISNYGYENLLFEILKKNLKKDTISLDVLPYGDIDGFLCLSDVFLPESRSKLFGVNISYSGRNTTDDFLEIYNDIEYESTRTRIKFEQESIIKLCNKIVTLSKLKNAVIDVFVTKRWKLRNVGQLSKNLEENGLKIRRFFYISSKTNRFVFDTLLNENENLHQHPYIIWDGKTAALQCNTKLQLYGTMFPIFIELLNPITTTDLCEEDLKLILWLVKKRIYRIMNFYSLKTPEIIYIFEQVKMLQLKNTNRFKLNVNVII